jgi:hypothetical protein
VRITDILLRQFTKDLAGIHAARLRVVFTATSALLRAGKTSLTSIGRTIAVRTTQKHGIKRVDRLLGNQRLWDELREFYRAIARRLIPEGSRPVIMVDWTSLSATMWTLTAAVGFQGRALAIYSESHPISRYANPAVHRAFLRSLREILPERCVPIIVTDAGFRSPWMKAVAALGWDYVCRLRGPNKLRKVGTKGWRTLRSFFLNVPRREKDFGAYEVGRLIRHATRVVGYRKYKGSWLRLDHRPHAKSSKGREGSTTQQRRAAREPWLLATSLQSSPKKVVGHYRLRMQIEQTFRDNKNSRFGLSLAEARTRTPRRADVLTLLANLAHLTTTLAGLIAEQRHLDRGYQANTIRTRRVFSLPRLGRLLLATREARCIDLPDVNAAWEQLTTRLAPLLEAL